MAAAASRASSRSRSAGPKTSARRAGRAHEVWALSALEGPLFTEIAQPEHFEAAFKPITEEQVAEAVVCGPDPARHLAAIRRATRAGYDHVCVHQIGPGSGRLHPVLRARDLPPSVPIEDRAARPSPDCRLTGVEPGLPPARCRLTGWSRSGPRDP